LKCRLEICLDFVSKGLQYESSPLRDPKNKITFSTNVAICVSEDPGK